MKQFSGRGLVKKEQMREIKLFSLELGDNAKK